jgi:hypothetical protein
MWHLPLRRVVAGERLRNESGVLVMRYVRAPGTVRVRRSLSPVGGLPGRDGIGDHAFARITRGATIQIVATR